METSTPSAKKPVVGIVIYPHATLIDFANPHAALAMFCETHILWKTLDPVPMDMGFSVVPTTTFANCPEDLDVLMLPGGFGSNAAMEDPEILDFLRDHGQRARFITSVCTGSLILGAAGLLDGYKAATHWGFYDGLAAMNIEGVHERVVADRNRLTGGGVTAGLDFGLTLLAKLQGDEVAKTSQLVIEYDPMPPFQCGHPRSVAPETLAAAKALMLDFPERAAAIGRASLQARNLTANAVA
jgi:cyclohexyl-isocyanide hydratase